MGPKHVAPTYLCTLVFHYFFSPSYASDQPGWSAFPAFTLHSGLAPWTCNLCSHMASALKGSYAWMLCCYPLEILNAWSRGLAFSLCTGSHKLYCWFCLLCIPVFTHVLSIERPLSAHSYLPSIRLLFQGPAQKPSSLCQPPQAWSRLSSGFPKHLAFPSVSVLVTHNHSVVICKHSSPYRKETSFPRWEWEVHPFTTLIAQCLA